MKTQSIKSKALKAAWTNWKANRYSIWSECLKAAWAWAKASKNSINIIVNDMFKFTQKAVCVNYIWYPLSQINCNYKNIDGCLFLESIEVPMWLYNSKK